MRILPRFRILSAISDNFPICHTCRVHHKTEPKNEIQPVRDVLSSAEQAMQTFFHSDMMVSTLLAIGLEGSVKLNTDAN